MGMGVGGSKGGPQADINMTPMIDVLLVLLIIFMVVQQGLQRGISVQIPPPPDETDTAQRPPDDQQIVLQVEPGPQYLINALPVAATDLRAKITEIYANRPRKVIFVKGAENMTYGDVIFAVDAARAGGVTVVGLVPRVQVGPATAAPPPAS